jgi:hypothetical protein
VPLPSHLVSRLFPHTGLPGLRGSTLHDHSRAPHCNTPSRCTGSRLATDTAARCVSCASCDDARQSSSARSPHVRTFATLQATANITTSSISRPRAHIQAWLSCEVGVVCPLHVLLAGLPPGCLACLLEPLPYQGMHKTMPVSNQLQTGPWCPQPRQQRAMSLSVRSQPQHRPSLAHPAFV